jgi:hypothetical protein
MLSAGVALSASDEFAGYGFDTVNNLGLGSFYGQKGGLLNDAASVLQFNGEWGFVVVWGSPAQVPTKTPSWHPDYDAVMNIAKTVDWSGTDLFPHFGMPSL